jgi:hypothetical protein
LGPDRPPSTRSPRFLPRTERCDARTGRQPRRYRFRCLDQGRRRARASASSLGGASARSRARSRNAAFSRGIAARFPPRRSRSRSARNFSRFSVRTRSSRPVARRSSGLRERAQHDGLGPPHPRAIAGRAIVEAAQVQRAVDEVEPQLARRVEPATAGDGRGALDADADLPRRASGLVAELEADHVGGRGIVEETPVDSCELRVGYERDRNADPGPFPVTQGRAHARPDLAVVEEAPADAPRDGDLALLVRTTRKRAASAHAR